MGPRCRLTGDLWWQLPPRDPPSALCPLLSARRLAALGHSSVLSLVRSRRPSLLGTPASLPLTEGAPLGPGARLPGCRWHRQAHTHVHEPRLAGVHLCARRLLTAEFPKLSIHSVELPLPVVAGARLSDHSGPGSRGPRAALQEAAPSPPPLPPTCAEPGVGAGPPGTLPQAPPNPPDSSPGPDPPPHAAQSCHRPRVGPEVTFPKLPSPVPPQGLTSEPGPGSLWTLRAAGHLPGPRVRALVWQGCSQWV